MSTTGLTIIIALITALVSPILVEWIKVNLIHKKQKDLLGSSIKFDEKIDNQLEKIMEELKCDRICIAQFHNGGHFYPTNKSIKKFSIFYERISNKATTIKEILQNIPVSLFPKNEESNSIFTNMSSSFLIEIDSPKEDSISTILSVEEF